MKHGLKRLMLAFGLTAFCATSLAVFDPVNDDTDLFRNNPNIPAERPNVLIVLDNTANWSSGGRFAAEKTALINTVAALDSSFNVGLMIFTQGGAACTTANVDGGYVRFGIRQLTTANKAGITAVVNAFLDAPCAASGDQGSSAVGGQGMHEAFLYFAGLTSRSGITQVKRDYAGSADNTTAGALPGNPFSSAIATVYTSPITDACMKNYIIFISNGPFSNGDDSPSSSLYAALPGVTSPSAGSFSSWVDEYADYLANTGVNVLGSNQKIFSYAVEVDPVTTGQGPDHTNLMKSMATRGKGKYFGVTSASAGAAIVDALLSIFTEIQAVNSVFAASTLPVSVNVRGTNLNQLYIGVFRPDSKDLPRWLGNLKAYQLKLDSITNTVFTVDAALNPAINSSTGFITATARSFWTAPNLPNSTYWSFRPSSVNGVGGSSDSPDGDLVEKGGAAQQLRNRYFAGGVNGDPLATPPFPPRPLYTCTQGPAFPVCNTNFSATSSLLSATPFEVANSDIDAGSLAIDTRLVAPLTAAVIKPVTALVDTRPGVLDNTGAGALPVNFISTNTDFKFNFSLNNIRTVSVTSLSNGANARSATLFSRQGASYTDVTLAGHGLTAGQYVIVTGTTNYNTPASGVTIQTVQSSSVIRINLPVAGGTATESSGTVTTSNTTVNAAAPNHGFANGQTVTIADASPSSFNGAKTITFIDANTFSYSNTVSQAPTGTITASASGTIVTATHNGADGFPGHGYVAGQTVTINNSVPSNYDGTYTVLSNPAPTATTFAYQTSTAITTPSTGTFVFTTTSGKLATVFVFTGPTLADYVPGLFTAGQNVNITGATPAGFNGNFNINTDADSNNTAVVGANNNIPPVSVYDYTADPDGVCGGFPGCTGFWRFDYIVPTGLGFSAGQANPSIPIQFSSTTSPTVTATLANHGFAVNDFITIAGASPASHNASWQVTNVFDANTFQYLTSGAFDAPSGTPTVRLTSNPRAYATIAGHGYGAAGTTINPFIVAGAVPAGYNGTFTTATVHDADTVSYPLTTAQGANTGTTITATTHSTTAVATSTAHGFNPGVSVVTIGGATPSAFNGSFTVATTPSADTFTYTIGSAQGAATGSITALSSGSGASERSNVINWVRGEDNFEDENANSSFTDTRASMHGDVLHSRPAVVNYNRRAVSDPPNIDNDVYIYYGGNDGVFRAVKGGFGSTAGDPAMGVEVWGFVAKEHFGTLKRLRLNSPGISSSFKKPYFFDGPMGTYTLDTNGDGKLVAADGDKVYIYLTMRRGGRAIYALDVSDPLVPKMLWRKGCPSFSTVPADIDALTGCDLGWGELGQTWSEPKVVSINCTDSPCGATDPVLIFGAGYDPLVGDPDPSTVTSSTTTSVVSSGTTLIRSMGRGLYVVNSRTGAIIWYASGQPVPASIPAGATYKQVTGMDYAISSDIAVVIGDPTLKPFRAYVGDTGGQMWRFDFGDADPEEWTVVKLGSIADQTTAAGRRQFQFAPDVVGATGFDMVISGTGDREHPFDTTVANRVYAFKDKRQTSSPVDGGGAQIQPTIIHATDVTFNGSTVKALLNISTQCIEIPGNCSGTAPEAAVGGSSASQNTSAALADSTNVGWFLTLAPGEKQVGSTLASGSGAVQFGTNQPSASAGGGACSPNLGVARQYLVNYLDGTAFSGTTLSTTYAGGGFLPSPVLVFVGLGGATGTGSTAIGGVGVGGTVSGGQLKVGAGASTGGSDNVATAVVCYGASCTVAPGSVLFSRLRKFWYKEID